MAAQGRLNLVYVVIAGVLGSTVGVLPWYYIGRYIDEERLKVWTERHGGWLKLSVEDVKKAKSWFNKSGRKAVLLSQFIIGARTLIALPAGISRMNLIQFLLYIAFSAAVWQGLLTYAGYVLGNQYGLINHYISPISHQIIVFVSVVVVIFWLVKRKS